jgi:DNA-binding CsgD family transcriptional regulator
MSQYEDRGGDSHLSKWPESSAHLGDRHEAVRLTEAHARPKDTAGPPIVRQLNESLTVLLTCMGELRDHSCELAPAAVVRDYPKQVLENAFQQIERVCALVRQLEDAQMEAVAASDRSCESEVSTTHAKTGMRTAEAAFLSQPGQKPLTKREREVLRLISEGHSNKQGALQMGISPRTFESHRAEAMRKLGARNTADLVRRILSPPGAV